MIRPGTSTVLKLRSLELEATEGRKVRSQGKPPSRNQDVAIPWKHGL